MSEPFIAEIRIWATNFAPRNWAFCNGQLLPIAQNTALFSLIGTTYGGDGRTTTALPNLQGRVVLHAGRGPGLTERRLGQIGGGSTATLTPNQIAPHDHIARGVDEDASSLDPAGKYFGTSDEDAYRDAGANAAMGTNAIGDTGGGQPHNNMQPYLAINYCIALQGVYPSRS